MVHLHGGTVRASSAGPDRGSEFIVSLPSSVGAQRQAPQASAPRPEHASLRIVIVDDNIDGALSLSIFLQQAGGHHTSAYYDAGAALHDAGAALQHAAADQPDVFILDIGLPDINGYELARRLKALPACAGAVFIALTGYGQPQDKDRARQAGFDHHVAKPADPHTILDLLGQLTQQP